MNESKAPSELGIVVVMGAMVAITSASIIIIMNMF